MRVVAIDGPAGAGKSTVGKALATRLGLQYLDTGAMYRAATLATLRHGVAVSDHDAVAEIARRLEVTIDDGIVTIDGDDVTREIRGREVNDAVSAVSANPAVRRQLVARQRQWAVDHDGGVIEGRDIGTVVFPDADLKLYITASPRERAVRRAAEIGGDVDEIEASLIERDRRDMSRADSPLRADERATLVDTTGRSVADIVDEIVGLLAER